MLSIGDEAPDFELPDQDCRFVRLGQLLASGPVVVFFYPAALSPGCTAQSCHFRDLAAEFDAVGASLVGISRDDVAKQKRFDTTHALGFPLLSDRDASVRSAYGVLRMGGHVLPARRVTFVVAPTRRIVGIVHHELSMNAHADRALQAVRRLRADAGDVA